MIWRKRDDCFENVAAEKGYGWFFSGLQTLFATDDLTLINFEGTLTDETGKKQKLYNFKGPAEYADILTLGSVEAVNVANNHTLDYGQKGKEDTIANLEAAGIIVSGGGQLGIFEKNGVKVGMTGYCFPYKDSKKDISADVKALREAGCQIVIASFHWGANTATTSPGNSAPSAARRSKRARISLWARIRISCKASRLIRTATFSIRWAISCSAATSIPTTATRIWRA